MGIRPPEVNVEWDECDLWTQACIMGYHQGREKEEMDLVIASLGGGKASGRSTHTSKRV